MATYAHWVSIVQFCKNNTDNEEISAIMHCVMPYMSKIPVEYVGRTLEKMYAHIPIGTHKEEEILALLIDSLAEVVDYATAGTIAVNLLLEK